MKPLLQEDCILLSRINYHLQAESVPILHKEIGVTYEDRIIAPAIQETVKAVTAKFTAEELITKRAEVKEAIQKDLFDRLQKTYIVVDNFNIVNFQFSEQFNQAIESKVSQVQASLTAQNKLEQVKFEAQQKIEQATGEARAIQIRSDALKSNPQVLQLEFINKWSGNLPQVYSTNGGSINPFIDIGSLTNSVPVK